MAGGDAGDAGDAGQCSPLDHFEHALRAACAGSELHAACFPALHALCRSWDVSLSIPYPDLHFGLAVVAGACQVSFCRCQVCTM